jgi:hypothetical protein
MWEDTKLLKQSLRNRGRVVRRFLLTGACYLLIGAGLTTLTGCGGGSDSAIETPETPAPGTSQFTGIFNGKFTRGDNEQGSTYFNVAPNDVVVGMILRTASHPQGDITGTVDDNGNADITITYPDSSIQIKGVLSLNTTTLMLTGNLTQTVGGVVTETVSVSLKKAVFVPAI